ncbi:hypothetical protein SAMD00019534_054480 [Acytostelium subglobosum LB1]|uniref:hypothetical protein n=1 Tax=Acytostelium subglobosum LB1 TaxID=1410327 RepID=UPI0006450DA2|nr:hypothetical protein SAMD00019534_054480 [Acytostelium subglobosum LB1]GAM22273.1 hypothetical protein SAMD00019534_054480 [Acytostelium subglobosum LB1]|eukprot:XP_012754393.1 hypothetical protein SAMD00019534_054480 [Acytostelium subglobosum LB1]
MSKTYKKACLHVGCNKDYTKNHCSQMHQCGGVYEQCPNERIYRRKTHADKILSPVSTKPKIKIRCLHKNCNGECCNFANVEEHCKAIHGCTGTYARCPNERGYRRSKFEADPEDFESIEMLLADGRIKCPHTSCNNWYASREGMKSHVRNSKHIHLCLDRQSCEGCQLRGALDVKRSIIATRTGPPMPDWTPNSLKRKLSPGAGDSEEDDDEYYSGNDSVSGGGHYGVGSSGGIGGSIGSIINGGSSAPRGSTGSSTSSTSSSPYHGGQSSPYSGGLSHSLVGGMEHNSGGGIGGNGSNNTNFSIVNIVHSNSESNTDDEEDESPFGTNYIFKCPHFSCAERGDLNAIRNHLILNHNCYMSRQCVGCRMTLEMKMRDIKYKHEATHRAQTMSSPSAGSPLSLAQHQVHHSSPFSNINLSNINTNNNHNNNQHHHHHHNVIEGGHHSQLMSGGAPSSDNSEYGVLELPQQPQPQQQQQQQPSKRKKEDHDGIIAH